MSETSVNEQPQPPAGEVPGRRRPTGHERRAARSWDEAYAEGSPPWDTGRPQPAILRLADRGAFRSEVLDAGCGTGENALHLASLGLRVLGVDLAQTALSIAREKAAARGLCAEFLAADARRLEVLDRTFETVLDCGLFHTLEEERRDYVASLASVTNLGGTLHLLCFSDAEAEIPAPHPVGEGELRAAFDGSHGWRVASVDPDRIQASFAPEGVPAWLAKIERIQTSAALKRARA